jgi:hypothetical protein
MKHRFEILHTWQGELLPVSEQGWIEVAIRAHTLDVCWDAPWWPEPDPDTPPGECLELCRYQAVELFLGNCGDTNYLELEFGPAGHWLILEFSSYRCLQSRHAPRFYTWERYHSTTCSRPHWARDEQPSRTRDTLRWTGRASLQGTSLLSRISKGNAHLVHRCPHGRTHCSAHSDPGGAPDFHRSDLFQALDGGSLGRV